MIKRRSKSVQFYFFRDHELFTLQKKKIIKSKRSRMLRTEVWLALRPEEFHLGSLPLPPPHPPPPHLRSLSPPETYQSAVWHIYPGPTLQNIHLFHQFLACIVCNDEKIGAKHHIQWGFRYPYKCFGCFSFQMIKNYHVNTRMLS